MSCDIISYHYPRGHGSSGPRRNDASGYLLTLQFPRSEHVWEHLFVVEGSNAGELRLNDALSHDAAHRFADIFRAIGCLITIDFVPKS